ncbi:MAG: PASTA domain-containing protein [Ferruginibacter sp.]
MFKFITHRPLWVNILFIVGLVLLMIFIFLEFLGRITHHGLYLTVPSVINKPTAEAIRFLESKGFEVIIQDSVYIDTAKRGIVIKQLPDPNSTVKINRTVLLTVNRLTLPFVDMPALQGKTLQYALDILKRTHLELGDTIYRADFMKGSVLEQKYNGNVILPGAKLPWGSKVDLIIGSGLADIRIMVPSLIGLTLGEAKLILEQNGIGLAAVIADPGVKDTLAAFVYKQNPPKFTEEKVPVYIQSGQLMDLWVSPVKKAPVDSTIIQ